MKNRDVLRILPEGSEVEAGGSESGAETLNPGATVGSVNILLGSNRLRATGESGLYRWNGTFGLLEHKY